MPEVPFWNLFDDGAPASWMDNADDYKEQPSDSADANRPDIWRYEGVRWRTSGLSPNNAAGLDITTSYDPDWGFCGAVFSDIGDGHVTSGTHPGRVWDATHWFCRTRYYIDAAVKAEAANLLPMQFYESDSRHGLSALNTGGHLEFYDWDGIEAYIETLDGSFSDPILWADIIDKLVEFTVEFIASAPGADDGQTIVSLRTSPDGTTWTDLGVVLNETGTSDWFDYRVDDVPYAMSLALGFAGLPGQCQHAELFRESVVPPVDPQGTPPLDNSIPCCDATNVTTGAESPGAGVELTGLGWTPRLAGGGQVPTAADPPPGEDWSDS